MQNPNNPTLGDHDSLRIHTNEWYEYNYNEGHSADGIQMGHPPPGRSRTKQRGRFQGVRRSRYRTRVGKITIGMPAHCRRRSNE
jgi:hypothetical protein